MGLMYPNSGFNPTALIGNTLEQAYAGGNCILFSKNYKPVTVIGQPCANVVTLVAPANNISSGTSTYLSNNNPIGSNEGRITATNKITGGNTTYSGGKKVELNQGFEVSGNSVFKAEIGGCSN